MKNNTTAIQKLLVSVISTAVVLVISIPIYLIEGFSLKYKIAVVMIFLLDNLFFAIFFKGRLLDKEY